MNRLAKRWNDIQQIVASGVEFEGHVLAIAEIAEIPVCESRRHGHPPRLPHDGVGPGPGQGARQRRHAARCNRLTEVLR